MGKVTDQLNEVQAAKAIADRVMAGRVAFQNLKNVAADTKATLNALKASPDSVAVDIRTEEAACVEILDKLIADLAAKAEFIDFKPE